MRKFVAEVELLTRGSRWVVDGNYAVVPDVVWRRADSVVWLDPPRHVVMRRIVFPTVRRLVTRVELWNGNRERWTNLVSAAPQRSVIAWAWTEHDRYRATCARLAREYDGLRVERVVDEADAARLLESLDSGALDG